MAVNWTANLAVGLTFPLISESSMGNYSFVPFAVIITVLMGFLYVYLPKTNERQVEEVADKIRVRGATRGGGGRRARRMDVATNI